jgi:hypothetical protein
MKLWCQLPGTRVLGTGGRLKFVPQRLTVLLSYQIVASVPLVRTLVEWKIAIVGTEPNRSEGELKCKALTLRGWVKRSSFKLLLEICAYHCAGSLWASQMGRCDFELAILGTSTFINR